jgi:NAD(P)-dependent dehydrogenase (short-subunit alcohol dehydrogenase family)
MYDKDLLAGRAGVVTGAGAGAGRAIALALAEHGADLVLAGRSPEPLDEVVRAVQDMGRRCVAVPTDVRVPEQAERMIRTCADQLGRLDFLVNAADACFLQSAIETPVDDFREVIDTVLSGAFFCAQAAGRVMREREGGRIVSVGSADGWGGAPGMAHSGAGRAATSSMTRTLAVEWAPYGILVNDIAAGPLDVEGSHGLPWGDPEVRLAVGQRVPLGRLVEPADIVGPVLFLLSDSARFVTGTTVWVDGGNRFWNG